MSVYPPPSGAPTGPYAPTPKQPYRKGIMWTLIVLGMLAAVASMFTQDSSVGLIDVAVAGLLYWGIGSGIGWIVDRVRGVPR